MYCLVLRILRWLERQLQKPLVDLLEGINQLSLKTLFGFGQ